jgi:hypothetical protein
MFEEDDKKLIEWLNKHKYLKKIIHAFHITSKFLPTILTILVIGGIIFGAIYYVTTSSYSISNSDLKIKVNALVDDLMNFADERDKNQPVTNWSEDFWTRSNKDTQYFQETTNQYFKDFAGDVTFCYKEFNKRGKSDEMLNVMIFDANWMSTGTIREIVRDFSTWENEL